MERPRSASCALKTWPQGRLLSHFTFEAELPESAGSQRLALIPWSFIWPLCNLRKRKLQADEPQGVAVTDLLRSSPSVALIDGFLKESLILTQTCKCVSLVLCNWLNFASRVISHPGTKYQFPCFYFIPTVGSASCSEKRQDIFFHSIELKRKG